MNVQKIKSKKWLTCSLETVGIVTVQWCLSSAYNLSLCFFLLLCPYALFFQLLLRWWWRCRLSVTGLGVFFCAGMSIEMKAMAMTILYVCCISFLSFSLCIISLLWVFCSVFSVFFLCFFGLIFRSLLCFWVPFFASGVLTFSALAPPMIFGPLFA